MTARSSSSKKQFRVQRPKGVRVFNIMQLDENCVPRPVRIVVDSRRRSERALAPLSAPVFVPVALFELEDMEALR